MCSAGSPGPQALGFELERTAPAFPGLLLAGDGPWGFSAPAVSEPRPRDRSCSVLSGLLLRGALTTRRDCDGWHGRDGRGEGRAHLPPATCAEAQSRAGREAEAAPAPHWKGSLHALLPRAERLVRRKPGTAIGQSASRAALSAQVCVGAPRGPGARGHAPNLTSRTNAFS